MGFLVLYKFKCSDCNFTEHLGISKVPNFPLHKTNTAIGDHTHFCNHNSTADWNIHKNDFCEFFLSFFIKIYCRFHIWTYKFHTMHSFRDITDTGISHINKTTDFYLGYFCFIRFPLYQAIQINR